MTTPVRILYLEEDDRDAQRIEAALQEAGLAVETRRASHHDDYVQVLDRGGFAHDLNNLLTVVLGYAELLLAKTPSADPRHREIVKLVSTAKRSAELTHQLLALSRKRVVEPEHLDLNAVLAQMEKMLWMIVGERVKLVINGSPHLGLVRADPRQIERILINLAVRARDAMPQRGTLTLETWNFDLDESFLSTHPGLRPGPHVLLTVTDSGTGMDAETQARAFDPTFSAKPAGSGMGLGLATVYELVARNQGHISLRSQPGRGTTFKIYLPQAEASRY